MTIPAESVVEELQAMIDRFQEVVGDLVIEESICHIMRCHQPDVALCGADITENTLNNDATDEDTCRACLSVLKDPDNPDGGCLDYCLQHHPKGCFTCWGKEE